MLYFNLISLLLIVAWTAVLGSQAGDIAVSARVYPLTVAALVTVCALVIAAQEFAGRAATEPLDGKLRRMLGAPGSVRIRGTAFVATWLLYTAALPLTGFVVATTAALAVSFWLLGVRRIVVGFFGALAFSVVFSVLFATVLYIPIPSGVVDQTLIETIYALRH